MTSEHRPLHVPSAMTKLSGGSLQSATRPERGELRLTSPIPRCKRGWITGISHHPLTLNGCARRSAAIRLGAPGVAGLLRDKVSPTMLTCVGPGVG